MGRGGLLLHVQIPIQKSKITKNQINITPLKKIDKTLITDSKETDL